MRSVSARGPKSKDWVLRQSSAGTSHASAPGLAPRGELQRVVLATSQDLSGWCCRGEAASEITVVGMGTRAVAALSVGAGKNAHVTLSTSRLRRAPL